MWNSTHEGEQNLEVPAEPTSTLQPIPMSTSTLVTLETEKGKGEFPKLYCLLSMLGTTLHGKPSINKQKKEPQTGLASQLSLINVDAFVLL